ncbi:MAG: formylglycine-generating enzyme family protein, partial [Mailhella sp.]
MKTWFIVFCCLAAVLSVERAQAAEALVLIQGGEFTMGSLVSENRREKDETAHIVRVRSFRIGVHEVTQKEYRDTMGTNPSQFRGDNLPVENVSWYDAIAYCNARSAAEG